MASRSDWTSAFTYKSVVPSYDSAGIMADVWGGSASADATAAYTSGIFGTTGYTSETKVSDFANLYSEQGNDYLSRLTDENYDPSTLTSLYTSENLFGGQDTGWTFVTTPGDISWDVSAAVDRQTVYGTNTAPVVVGSKGMRDLNLRDALVEGFSRLKTVEDKVIALENLQNFTLDGTKGFVNVPVYQVWANSKRYGFANGADGGYFVIKSISVKETMRDLDGNSTRANVDVSLVQVPAYQVDSGRDQASQSLTGASSKVLPVVDAAGQRVGVGTGTGGSSSGATAPSATGTGSTRNPTNTPPRTGGLDAQSVRRAPTRGL